MQRENYANIIPPSVQMKALHGRNLNALAFIDPSSVVHAGLPLKGLHGLGLDPGTVATAFKDFAEKMVDGMKKIFGIFTKDPNRDIHIPAQNAAVDGYTKILDDYNTLRVQGTLNQSAIREASSAIKTIAEAFYHNMEALAARYPENRSRYIAGGTEVRDLGYQIIADNMTKDLPLYPSGGGGIFQPILDFFNPPSTSGGIQYAGVGGSGPNTLILAGLAIAAIYFAPRLFGGRR